MSGVFWLDWAVLAISLSNTIILFWLGTTVLFNTEQRSWGGWLAAMGLLLGGVFFISHTAILGYELDFNTLGIELWWEVGLIAIALLPFIWYVMMLWYSGFWEKLPAGKPNSLRRRHTVWFGISAVFLIALFILTLLNVPQSQSLPFPSRSLDDAFTLNNFPLILILYPMYVILCISLSIDALRKPGPTSRTMGEIARVRARPWLIGAAIMLWLVSLGVLIIFYWLANITDNLVSLYQAAPTISLFDLIIESLIAAAIILIGQAVVAYEVFTGKTLPRRELLRQWRQAVLFAFGYGGVIGFTFSTNLRPIYPLLLSALLLAFFFAMLSLRSYRERERYIQNLRPFVAAGRFYEQLLTPSSSNAEDTQLQQTFDAICGEVLNTGAAALLALGPLAPLAGPPLNFPHHQAFDLVQLRAIMQQLDPKITFHDLTQQNLPGLQWAVPLWSQRGQIGMLFFGSKQDQGVYSQEEIEIAQASCERLIDTHASLEIAKRLMALQRRHMAQSQVIDQRTRRILHDDILQGLHTAILNLDNQTNQRGSKPAEAIGILSEVHQQISQLLRELPPTSPPEFTRLGLVDALRRIVEEEFGSVFDAVTWKINQKDANQAALLPALETEVLFYAAREALRNAGKHARPSGRQHTLNISIGLTFTPGLTLTIEDSGTGISQQDKANHDSGQGLALHSTMMAVIGGELQLESEPGRYTRIILSLPETPPHPDNF